MFYLNVRIKCIHTYACSYSLLRILLGFYPTKLIKIITVVIIGVEKFKLYRSSYILSVFLLIINVIIHNTRMLFLVEQFGQLLDFCSHKPYFWVRDSNISSWLLVAIMVIQTVMRKCYYPWHNTFCQKSV